MDTQTTGTIEQLSSNLIDTAERIGPALVSIRSRRWRTTGVAYGAPGELIAAAHALGDSEEVTISTAGGDVRATVVGRDESLDLALLRTDAAIATLSWRDALPKPGELVLGLSRPAGALRTRIGQVVAVGERTQTPLGGRLDAEVELAWLGRNALATAVVDLKGQAVGFAVGGGGRRGWVLPSATLARAVEAIRRVGQVRRGYLGVIAQPVRLPPEAAQGDVGLLITAVEPGSPAAAAGLLLGDVLVGIDGDSTASISELWSALGPERVGQKVRLGLLRAGKPHEVELEVKARS